MTQEKYLVQRNGLWMFNWRVPKDCRSAFNGKTYYTQSLKTQSKREALLRRDVLLGEIRKVVADTRADSGNEYKDTVKHLIHVYKTYSEEALAATYEVTAGEKYESDAYRASAEACQIVYEGIETSTIKPSLKDALLVYEEEKKGKIKEKTLRNYQTSVKYFLEFNQQSDMLIEDITKGVVRTYIKACRTAGVAERSIGNRLRHLTSIFNVAQNDGLFAEDKVNPFANHKLSRNESTPYQLIPEKALLGVFKDTLKYKHSDKSFHKYLLPRLGYITGARREELCSLRVNQVVTEDDITYLRIGKIGKEDAYDGKNENAFRRVPIHSSLVEDVIYWKDKQKTPLLFPMLKANTIDNKMGDAYGKIFGRLKNKHGAKGREYGFHSFRDHVATALEQARVPENEAVWLLGHTRNLSLSYKLYSKGPALDTLRDNIEKAIVLPKHFLEE